MRKSSKNTKTTTTPTVKPQEVENKGNNNIYVNVYPILQLNCIVDGVELSWRDIKKALNKPIVDGKTIEEALETQEFEKIYINLGMLKKL